ncbi:pantothenate kinase [Putridiphycobacter roseus]|uniref:Type III pantothenate kinase n=1 Tax=Putridiphycobacter roseus TaxID=2219161 RepID=A0A2W1N4C9_9FLAO|nr:type III pantothenate kinase [Putridiphycobacter roseus]PZE18694.1 pantothenate kinase [Putridiphycobacter roseus]
MNLILDQGNTYLKAAIFNGKDLMEKENFSYDAIEKFEEYCKLKHISNAIISSVVHKQISLEFLNLKKIIHLDENTGIPITNNYTTPKTLGRDRLANAVGAWSLKKNENILIIDAGTCIKYDLMDKTGTYLGGNISPGLKMRFEALHTLTDKLPLIKVDKTLKQEFGTDTQTSIQCGVLLGMQEEINGFINRYKQQFNQLTIFMTGGDSIYFDKTDKNHIFAVENLTLIGLNEILNHNA